MRRTALLSLIALLLAAVPAGATSLTATLGFTFSGTPPVGAPTVTIDDNGGTGSVLLTISAGTLTGTEFIDDIYLNATNPATLNIAFVSGQTANSVTQATDSFKADGTGGFYDLLFDFPPPPGGPSNVFGAGETSNWLITRPGLTVNDFVLRSLCTQGCVGAGYFGAAHIQAIPLTQGGDSGWVAVSGNFTPTQQGFNPVPEPGTLVLLGTGLVAALRKVRR